MTRVAAVVVLVLTVSCVVHVHIDDARTKPVPVHEPVVDASATGDGTPVGSVAGVVVVDAGTPVRARVAAVYNSGGSFALGTDGTGRFQLSKLDSPDVALHASTEDGRLAIVPHVARGADGLQLVVRPAAQVSIAFQGSRDVRCAVFHDGIRIEDFTLHASKPARVVVPAGEVAVQVYDQNAVLAEQKVRLTVGQQQDVGFGTIGSPL